jgi:hypothetical protein
MAASAFRTQKKADHLPSVDNSFFTFIDIIYGILTEDIFERQFSQNRAPQEYVWVICILISHPLGATGDENSHRGLFEIENGHSPHDFV